MIHDTKRAVADGILRSEVRRIAREVARRCSRPRASADDDARRRRDRPSCSPASRSTAPTCPRAASTSTQAFALAREHRPDLAGDARRTRCRSSPTRDAAPARRFQQTSGHGDGQGRRGQRVLPLVPAHLAQRGRRRPVASSRSPSTSSTRRWPRARREWPRRDDHAVHPRHQARRGRPGPAHRARRGARRLGARARPAAASSRRCRDPGFGSLLWQAVLGAWPADPTADAAARLRREGDARGRRPDHLDRAGRGLRGRRARRRRRGVRRRRRCAAVLDGLRRHGSRGPAGPTRSRPSCSRSPMPGVPDVYQGSELWEQSLVDPDNRRPVDFDVRAELLAALDGGRAPLPTVDDRARPSCWSPRRRCGCAATGPSCSRRTTPVTADRRRRRPRARLRPRRRGHGRHPAAGRASPLDGGWGDTVLELPPGSWRDVLTGRALRRRRSGWSRPARRPTRSRCWSGRTRDGSRTVRRLGAARRSASRLRVGDEIVDDDARRRRLVDARRRRSRTGERRLRLPARRRRRRRVPDPRSRRQPDGVHERSRTFDATRVRLDGPTRGPAASSPASVIYELHVGTFTPEGTLDAAIGKLDHLVDSASTSSRCCRSTRSTAPTTGATTACCWYAVHEAYGGPGGVPAVRRRLPRRRARRDPGRGLQPPRPVGQLPAAVRAVPQGRARNTWGDAGQPRRRRLATRCAATSSTTR